jgi:hypothetical protein
MDFGKTVRQTGGRLYASPAGVRLGTVLRQFPAESLREVERNVSPLGRAASVLQSSAERKVCKERIMRGQRREAIECNDEWCTRIGRRGISHWF